MKQNGNGSGKVDLLYATIKERIISTEYAPGEVLNEKEIAEEFNVSRTPVREALRRLQQEKWLNVLPQIGMQVGTFDINQLKDLFNTKEALETLAVQSAIDNAAEKDIEKLRELIGELGQVDEDDFPKLVEVDHEIHSFIWKLAGNSMLDVYLPDLQERLRRSWMHTRKQGVMIDKNSSFMTFNLIVDAISERDKEKARMAVHEHMEYHRNEMRVCLL